MPGQVVLDIAAKASIVIPVILIADLIWLAVGFALSSALRHPVLNRAINVALAILLLASVLVAFVL